MREIFWFKHKNPSFDSIWDKKFRVGSLCFSQKKMYSDLAVSIRLSKTVDKVEMSINAPTKHKWSRYELFSQ